MMFCERFHLTPFEYNNLPKKLIEEWVMMANIKDQSEKAKQS